MNAALQALDLRVDLGGQEVLHEVNLTLPAGRWTSIVGPNGAGKSTLLKALSGLLPAQGQVHWFGQPMAGIARRERGQQLSWLGQGEGASDDLRVSDVVMLGRLPFQDWLSAPSALDQQMVESALKATQAWDWRDRSLTGVRPRNVRPCSGAGPWASTPPWNRFTAGPGGLRSCAPSPAASASC